MDLPVEATVHLGVFPSEAEVRQILRSHGFQLMDLSGDRVRIKGSFLKLKAAKASLEPLLSSKTKADVTPAPTVSSGAIPKYYPTYSLTSDANRGREKTPRASPSWISPYWTSPDKHPTPPDFSTAPEQRGSLGPVKESFFVDADVFHYAKKLRNKDVEDILYGHNVKMEASEVGDGFYVTLRGKNARIAAGKLQSLMDDLSKSLRTQEVPLRDLDREGRALLERIGKDRDIYNSVLVRPMNGQLHLIGSSGESYELKQRLLGRPVGRTGRTSFRSSRTRSSSVPPVDTRNAERDIGAVARPSPAGYSPSKYQDDKWEGAMPDRGAAASAGHGGALRGRSQSETRRAQRVPVQEAANKPPKSPRKALTQFVNMTKKDFKAKVHEGYDILNRKWM